MNPTPLDIARGVQDGWSGVRVFGRNSDVDTGTEDVWSQGGIWAAPTAARIHAIVSGSVNDAAAGTGARTVQIIGLDSNYDVISEIVTLNGTGAVNTVNSYIRINSMEVLTVGSGGTNAGAITATAAVNSTVTIGILAGDARSTTSVYTVPNNHTMYIMMWYCSVDRTAAASGVIDNELQIRKPGQPFALYYHIGTDNDATSFFQFQISVPLVVPEKSDVKIQVTASADNCDVHGGYSGYLIKDNF